MQRVLKCLVLSVFLLVGLSCKKNTQKACDCLLRKGTANPNEITGRWIFDSFSKLGRIASKKSPAGELNDMTIEFVDGVSKAVGQCNFIIGNEYLLTGDNGLSFQEGVVTLVGCPDNQKAKWDERYFDALRGVKCYVVKDNKLIIYFENTDTKNLMNFKAQ